MGGGLSDDTFAALMAPLGPFEPAPLLAVGVSGGADSLALVLLADAWARVRGGQAVALTVDHRLRPDSTAEAARVAVWMAERGIPHHILTRQGPPPAGDIQAAARAARIGLLTDWCARAGCLHLLLAHHQDDQAETLVLRLARGSGVAGLSGMAAVSWRAACRILRPLLPVPAATLRTTLQAHGQAWIEDPSNRNPAYARVRLRALAPLLAAEGADARRLADTARRLGRTRRLVEAQTDGLLAAAAWVDSLGYAWLDPEPLRRAPEEIALRALGTVLAVVGGNPYGPRGEHLERLLPRLGQAATLGQCRLMPDKEGRLLIVRETRALPELLLQGGEISMWDRRFRVTVPPVNETVRLGPLGEAGWKHLRSVCPALMAAIPKAAATTLPALWRLYHKEAVPAAVPSLGWALPGYDGGEVTFFPSRALTVAGFRLAPRPGCIM